MARSGVENTTSDAGDGNVKSGTVARTVESGYGQGKLTVLIVDVLWLGLGINPAIIPQNVRRATHFGSMASIEHWTVTFSIGPEQPA